MLAVRGGSGFGDALYVQGVARYLVENGHQVEACSDWPDVFSQIKNVKVSPFRRDRIDRLAHYSTRRRERGTTQWEDVCVNARIPQNTPLVLDWAVKTELADTVYEKACGKRIALVQLPRAPFGRIDGYGMSLLPDCRAIQHAIDALDGYYKVQVGKGRSLHAFDGIDLDLANATSVAELLDLAAKADLFVGYVSYFVPLAESFGKQALFVWSADGLKSPLELIANITPSKILHRKDLCRFVLDSATPGQIGEAIGQISRQN